MVAGMATPFYRKLANRKKRRPKPPPRRPPLTTAQILAWADEHRAATGRWPQSDTGLVHSALGEVWANLDQALRVGLRGLPGGSTLRRLLAEHRGVRNLAALPRLTSGQIVVWARAYQRRTGQWPCCNSGPIPDAPGETWSGVNAALGVGRRGLPGGSSLAQLLAEQCGRRNRKDLPALRLSQILAWADRWRLRTGRWPTLRSGPIPEAPAESWHGVDDALRGGRRGLAGGSSLARLLAQRRALRNRMALPRLSPKQILAWADAWHARTGTWPQRGSGAIPEAPGEAWQAVNVALHLGARGLPGGSSLAQLLAANRGVPNPAARPPLTVGQVLAWADRHRRRTGRWPRATDGPVVGVAGETWMAINAALVAGRRGLPGDSSLARLLAEHRGVRNRMALPPLRVRQIRSWAQAYRRRAGAWPTRWSGPIAEAPAETWMGVDAALKRGHRGLLGGSSLARLFGK
jgi:hypothetical protein